MSSGLTPERLAEIRERIRFLAEPGDRDPALIEHLRTTTAASAPKAVFDAEELLAEVDRLRDGIEALADWWQRIPGDGGYETACRDHGQHLRALLSPTEGEADDPA